MDGNANTPLQEAISIITIVAMLVAVGCYCAELGNLPILAPCLLWLAVQGYYLLPALNNLPGSQATLLVGATIVGITFFIVSLPLAPLLAALFARQGIANIERQTRVLRTRREKVRKVERNRDRFLVG